jgi:hypothetical protein
LFVDDGSIKAIDSFYWRNHRFVLFERLLGKITQKTGDFPNGVIFDMNI